MLNTELGILPCELVRVQVGVHGSTGIQSPGERDNLGISKGWPGPGLHNVIPRNCYEYTNAAHIRQSFWLAHVGL